MTIIIPSAHSVVDNNDDCDDNNVMMNIVLSLSLYVRARVCTPRMSIFNNNKLYVSATCELNNDPVMLLIVPNAHTTYARAYIRTVYKYTNALYKECDGIE